MTGLTGMRSQRDRFADAVELVEGKLSLIAERDQPPDYVAIVISDEMLRRCGVADYFDKAQGAVHRDLRRAIKAMAMKYRIPTQLLRQQTIEGRDPTPAAKIAWNFFTGLYHKAGGFPWVPHGLQPQGLGKVRACLVGDGHALYVLDGQRGTGRRFATEHLSWRDRAVEGASQTAIMTAQFRAAHALVDPDPIFEDPFALALADRSAAEVLEFLAANVPDSCAHVVRLFVCQRSRFVEQEVERAVGGGVDQYVDLGAGLNSFAWRRPELMAGLDLFEVDHPATQAWKRARLTAAGLACPLNLRLVGVDFRDAETLGERLTAAGFDPARASVWSWLGVIQYLPLAAVRSTLGAVAGLAASGSKLVASYGVPDELMEPASREFTELTRAFTARIGEPQITWVAPGELEALARVAGWPRVRSVDPSSLAPWFAGRTDGLEPVGAEWLLVAEMGTP